MWNILTRSLRHINPNAGRLCERAYVLYDTPPVITETLKEKLERMNYKDPELHFKTNIGLPSPMKVTKAELKKRMRYLESCKTDKELEKLSRTLTLEVDLDEINTVWAQTSGPHDICKVAEHYGIYKDLFGEAYFLPYVHLEIGFPQSDKSEAPVYRGNIVKPSEATVQPNVRFQANDNDLWTLVLTNPDGHLTQDNMEYVHWFVGNIKGNKISSGEVIWDYLQPFPTRGVGFQRFVFILYKQEKKIDYTSLKSSLPRLELEDRNFKTLEFYRTWQDHLTPGGLAFFQSDWDVSVIKTFHDVLNMDEPVFEYDFQSSIMKKQEWFPRRKAFNLYLDKYRDPRDIAKEYFLKKSEKYNPFEKPKKPFPYPNVYDLPKSMPSWLKVRTRRDRIGKGRIVDQRDEEYQ